VSRAVDARGMECPKPVVMTKNALDRIPEGILTVLVDAESSRANVRRLAESQGCTVTEAVRDGYTELTIAKGFPCDLPEEAVPSAGQTAGPLQGSIVYITSDQVGPDAELGQHLLKVFIRNMLEVSREDLPHSIVFVNRGVHVPCRWDDTIEDLHALIDMGVQVFSCGVCLKHYEMEAELKVGEVGNAFDTVQGFLGPRKHVNIC